LPARLLLAKAQAAKAPDPEDREYYAHLIGGSLAPADRDRRAVRIQRIGFRIVVDGQHLEAVFGVERDRLDIVGETNIEGSPDLASEVLSPAHPAHDRSLKYQLYEEAGVPEYWILDPLDRTVEVYVLQDGIYEQIGKWSDGETARSVVLEGFSVPVNEVIPA